MRRLFDIGFCDRAEDATTNPIALMALLRTRSRLWRYYEPDRAYGATTCDRAEAQLRTRSRLWRYYEPDRAEALLRTRSR